MAVQAQNPSAIFLFSRSDPNPSPSGHHPRFPGSHHGPCRGADQNAPPMGMDFAGGVGGIQGAAFPPPVGRKRGRDPQVSTGLQLALEEEGGGEEGRRRTPPADVEAQLKLQGEEMELFLRLQGEGLRRRLAESGTRHYRALAEAAGREVARRLAEKQEQLEAAARRGAELGETAARLEAEAAAWRARAGVGETAAAELRERLRTAAAAAAMAGDEESTCAGGVEQPEPTCRACGAAPARVVALPCRHLSLCLACDAAPAPACPACGREKAGSVEVYL